jgi:hypothetical protein
MDWQTIEQQIIQEDQKKWDKKATGQLLRVLETGMLEITNGQSEKGSYSLSDLATSQMCQKLGIPVDYYRRLPGEMKALVGNFDFHRLKEETFLLRGKGEWIRAFLSGQYVAYNNAQIAETVQALLGQAAVTVKTLVLEETHMFLKIVTEDIFIPRDGLKAGVMIGNSEVGLGSISVEPFVFRKACTNDLVVAQEKVFRHPHIHLNASELNSRMAEGISNAFQVASSLLDAFLKTHEEPIPDPVEIIRRLTDQRKLSQKFTDEVISSFQAEPEPSRFGVINAFTSAAQKLNPLQRIEVERFAGTLLDAKI